MRLTRFLFVTCALCAALIACGGGGRGGGGVIPGSGGSQGSKSRPAVTLKMVIPKTTQITSARTKKPEYVSAAVASIVYEITTPSGTTSLVSGNDYANVAASPSPCTSGSNGLVCTISISSTLSASGTYNVSIATYDAAQSANCIPGAQSTTACAGNLLGFATLPETITVGSATPVAVTLGGIPAYLQGQALTGYVDGSGNNSTDNQLTIYGSTPQTGVAEFLDADGNVIIPPGAPTVTASSSNTAALTVAVATPTPGQYQITWTPVMSGNYVQPGSYTVTLSIAVPNTNIVDSYPLTIQLVHSGVFTAVCGGQNDQANVFGYIDGNTNGASPDLTISSGLASCSQAPGVATDHSGNLYVADGTTLWEFPVAPGTNPAPIASAGAAQGLESPYTVALDRQGNVYVGDTSADAVFAFDPPASGSFGNPVVTLSSDFNGYEPGGVGADNAGNLYIAVQADGYLQIFQTASIEGGLSPSSPVNALASLSPSQYGGGSALAIDVQPSPSTPPNIWTAGESSTSSGVAWSWSPLGALLNTYQAGGVDDEGIAVDGNGLVYAAYYQGTYPGPYADVVAPLSPPSYTSGSPMAIPSPVPFVVSSGGALPVSISVAVAPAAGVLGNRSGGGSPSPLNTQSPAPSLRHPGNP